jgi:hypothetical protein
MPEQDIRWAHGASGAKGGGRVTMSIREVKSINDKKRRRGGGKEK